MYCSPPGFSVLGILQARIPESVAISSSRGSSWPRNRTQVSCTVGRFFTIWATSEALIDLNYTLYEIHIYLQMCVWAHKALFGSATGHLRLAFPSFSHAASATLTLLLLLKLARLFYLQCQSGPSSYLGWVFPLFSLGQTFFVIQITA